MTFWELVRQLERAALAETVASGVDPGALAAHLEAVADRRRALRVELTRCGRETVISVTTSANRRDVAEVFHLLDVSRRLRDEDE